MRIVGGRFRGRKLADVGAGDESARLRPTTDRMRENLFNLLTNGRHGDLVRGASVFDAFAGTGALGFEALSRGAAAVTFWDTSSAARRLIKKNAEAFAGFSISVENKDACQVSQNGKRYDLVFLDPPYGKGLWLRALETLKQADGLSDRCVVVVEEGSQQYAPEGFRELLHRRYGNSWIHLFVASNTPAGNG